MFKEILEEELSRESVFVDIGKLHPDYVPHILVHREEEFRTLARMFKPVLEKKISQRATITGSVGVGKTALAKRFGEDIPPAAKKYDLQLDYIHINCRKQKTPYAVLHELAEHYMKRLPPRGFSAEELLSDVLDYLNKHDAYLVLTLDEIDFFIRLNGPDMLYTLTRVTEEAEGPNRISILAIARDPAFGRLLDPATQSTFMHNVIKLDRYSAPQLIDILNQRIRQAFKPGVIEQETVSLIADISARWGDARLALELLWKAGMCADEEHKGAVIPEHVRRAKAEVHPEVRKEALRDLEHHQQLTLLGLARRLKRSGQAYALTGEVERAYRVVCEEYGERPRSHTQLLGRLKHMEGLGLLDLSPSGPPHKGRSRRISVPDVPVEMLENELEQLLRKRKKRK